jgi:tRNA(fMet)-specific endonuclease VapC
MKYLIDSNICVYIINNRVEGSAEWIKVVGIENVMISSITVAELEYGLAKSNRYEQTQQSLYKFLSGFEIIDFDMTCAQAYGALRADLQRKGTPIGNMDMLIGATALARNLTLITNNTDEFKRIANLSIENWVVSPPLQ